ncbi:MAG: hypothetical protein D6753_00545 [Planctomycetota bacterium]|nr:MAG: hypothetical protein D6753_00545 [Planctomycetota bacterium]
MVAAWRLAFLSSVGWSIILAASAIGRGQAPDQPHSPGRTSVGESRTVPPPQTTPHRSGNALPESPQEGPSLIEHLHHSGITFPGGERFALPEHAIRADTPAAERAELLAELARPYSWQQFSRRSVVAPVRIRIQPLEDQAHQRLGYLATSAFIAYAAIPELQETSLLESTLGESSGEAFQIRPLTPEELEAVGSATSPEDNRRWFHVRMNLLKRVVIRGVLEVESHIDAQTAHVLWMMTSDFSDSSSAESEPPVDLRCTWSLLHRDATGQTVEGDRHPYRGMGGCLFVTETGLAQDQLLVESFWVLHEPAAWFSGSNQLRSKLPLMLQENAREFRRRIAR